jgi:hypothetical protein
MDRTSFDLEQIMKKLALILMLSSSAVYASNDLEKWNSEASKNIRKEHIEKLEKTTYREISSKASNVSSDMKTVQAQVESRATVAGSKSRVVAEAVLQTDKSKVSKYFKKIIKGGGALGTALLVKDLILESLDYIMGEGSQIVRLENETEALNYTSKYLYEAQAWDRSGNSYPSPDQVCQSAIKALISSNSEKYEGSYAYLSVVNGNECYYVTYHYGVYYLSQKVSVGRPIDNPNYDPNYKLKEIPVTEQQLDADIDNIFNDPNKEQLAKQMIKEAYTFSSLNSDNSELFNDVSNHQKDILNSDNPASSNLTSSTPKVDNGKTGTSDSSSTSQGSTTQETIVNPDGSTTNIYNTTNSTTNTSTFELPAFCSWASIVCEWIGWTQEDETSSDTKIKFEDEDEDEVEAKTDIEIKGSCPAPEKIHIGSIFNFDIEISYDPACELAEKIKPVIVAVGFFLYVLIVGGIKGSD